MLNEIRWLAVAGGFPCLGLMLGVLFSFLFYPYDFDAASKVLMTFSGAGALIGIVIVVHRIRKALKGCK